MSGAYAAGDVFWAPDPYDQSHRPRPWLVLAADTLPFEGEECICAALTRSDLRANRRVGESWVSGGNRSVTSYCSPWVLATIKHDAVVNPQGSVTEEFVATITRQSIEYLREECT